MPFRWSYCYGARTSAFSKHLLSLKLQKCLVLPALQPALQLALRGESALHTDAAQLQMLSMLPID